MSICPLDKQKYPLDISNAHSSIGRTEMYREHSNVHWTYCSGIGHVWSKGQTSVVLSSIFYPNSVLNV